jgi:NAD(P)-dependent dehydrogenase (short-subunit alcohol dehydrogenase family)
VTPAKSSLARLDGKVCVITGATAGIGKAGALALAGLGAELVLVGRSPRRLARVAREVAGIANQSSVRTFVADLSSLESVRSLAGALLTQEPRIDVLINNAGVFTRERRESVDGFETQFAVNHLAPFLLTNLLIERLASSAPSRVVNVASQVEKSGSIDFADLQGTREYDGLRAYRQSKLANMLFTRELGRRVAGLGVATIALHPGVYTTRLLDDYNGWSRLVTVLRGRGLPEPDLAGSVIANAAGSPDLAEANAVYVHEHAIQTPSPQAQDDVLARRLWDVSTRLVGLDREVDTRAQGDRDSRSEAV